MQDVRIYLIEASLLRGRSCWEAGGARDRTIKLSESDVPESLEFRRWSIRTPRACLGTRYGRTAEDWKRKSGFPFGPGREWSAGIALAAGFTDCSLATTREQ
jgi:hypothetical protein